MLFLISLELFILLLLVSLYNLNFPAVSHQVTRRKSLIPRQPTTTKTSNNAHYTRTCGAHIINVFVAILVRVLRLFKKLVLTVHNAMFIAVLF